MMLDILITAGRYPDYEKNQFTEANIGIKDGKVAYIGSETPEAEKTINAEGKVVSPGFIDIHMHEENFANEGKEYVISKMMLRQGVTTCVGGNCGVQYQTLREFKDTINELGGSPVNYAMLTGYNWYRTALGLGHFDAATKEQWDIIRGKMQEDLKEGAMGISFGIEYDPGITFDEIIYGTEASDDPNLLVAAHYRTDCIGSIDSITEMVEIQKRINKRFQISHLSSCSAMGQMKESLELINRAMDEDPRLNFDTYPYNAFSTTINSTVFDDGCLEAWGKDYKDLMLTDDPYKNVYCTEEIFKDARKNYPKMLVVAFVMNEEEIAEAVANPKGMVASDGIINHGNGHPRAAGTFPIVLGKYVREEKRPSLIDALKKMTIEPAKRLDLENRKGVIKMGADADITVFDPDTIIDGATFGDIATPPVGIDYVIVGGQIAAKDNEIITERAGRFISYFEK